VFYKYFSTSYFDVVLQRVLYDYDAQSRAICALLRSSKVVVPDATLTLCDALTFFTMDSF